MDDSKAILKTILSCQSQLRDFCEHNPYLTTNSLADVLPKNNASDPEWLTTSLGDLNTIEELLEELRSGTLISEALETIKRRRDIVRLLQMLPPMPVSTLHRHPEILSMVFAYTPPDAYDDINAFLRVCTAWRKTVIDHEGGRLFSKANWDEWPEEKLRLWSSRAAVHGHQVVFGHRALLRYRCTLTFEMLAIATCEDWIDLQVIGSKQHWPESTPLDVVAIQVAIMERIVGLGNMPRLRKLFLGMDVGTSEFISFKSSIAIGLQSLSMVHVLGVRKEPWISIDSASIGGRLRDAEPDDLRNILTNCANCRELIINLESAPTKSFTESIQFPRTRNLALTLHHIPIPKFMEQLYFPTARRFILQRHQNDSYGFPNLKQLSLLVSCSTKSFLYIPILIATPSRVVLSQNSRNSN